MCYSFLIYFEMPCSFAVYMILDVQEVWKKDDKRCLGGEEVGMLQLAPRDRKTWPKWNAFWSLQFAQNTMTHHNPHSHLVTSSNTMLHESFPLDALTNCMDMI